MSNSPEDRRKQVARIINHGASHETTGHDQQGTRDGPLRTADLWWA
jgi:hypothetical protein